MPRALSPIPGPTRRSAERDHFVGDVAGEDGIEVRAHDHRWLLPRPLTLGEHVPRRVDRRVQSEPAEFALHGDGARLLVPARGGDLGERDLTFDRLRVAAHEMPSRREEGVEHAPDGAGAGGACRVFAA